MTPITDKIKQLPDGVDMVLYQRSLHPYHEPITTDDLKALVSELETAKRALEGLLATVHQPNPNDPNVWHVSAGNGVAFSRAVNIAQAALKSE